MLLKLLLEKVSPVDSELLISHVSKLPREKIISGNFKLNLLQRVYLIHLLFQRIIKNTPVAVLTKKTHFYKSEFYINKNILVPSPDTEILVEYAVNKNNIPNNSIICEIGGGSGAICLSIAKDRPDLKVLATEKSKKAFNVLEKNLKKLDLKNINIFNTDFLPKNTDLTSNIDVVIANLPYVESDIFKKEKMKHGPKISLDGGKDGLDVYRELLKKLKNTNVKLLIFECSAWQVDELQKIYEEGNWKLKDILFDLSGQERGIALVSR